VRVGRLEGRRRKRWLIPGAAIVVALMLLAAGCTKKSEAQLASEALSKGIAAQQAGRLTEAAADYREVLVHDPNNKFAYYNLGLIDQTNGALASAESNYNLSLNIDPQFEPALFNLAIVEHDLRNLKESISLYKEVLKIAPDNANAHLNYGFALIEAHQKAKGQDQLTIAVQLDPTLADRVNAVNPSPNPKPNKESPSPSETTSPSG
jgi:tetratricopeptide (TPR) repeat protein